MEDQYKEDKKKPRHHFHSKCKQACFQATTTTVETKTVPINLCAVYCPPRRSIKSHVFQYYFNSLRNRHKSGGDWNSNHISWGSG